MKIVQKGSTVSVEYKGMFEDGRLFDSSEGKEPLKFKVGDGEVVQGFEEAVISMNEGEVKTVTISPAKAYGSHDSTLRKSVPKSMFPPNQKLEKGMVLGMKLPTGETIPATVSDYTNDTITIDLNHPLAGKTLTFRIKVVKVE